MRSLWVLCLGFSGIISTPGSAQKASVKVPFVGCESDGQLGPQAAPQGQRKEVDLQPEEADLLAYYKAEDGPGVLAPRGWFCFSTYGSNGSSLFVTPTQIDSKLLFTSGWKGFSGPAVQVSVSIGDTSGRFEVAEVIARVFPAYRSFARSVEKEGFASASSFHYKPYATDRLTYQGRRVVEFETPAKTDGLGTRSRLNKNDAPIRGAAILSGETPDLIQLSYRLPNDRSDLGPAMLRQVEMEAGH